MSDALVLGVSLAVPEPWGSDLQAHRIRFGDSSAHGVPTHVTLLPPTTIDAVVLPEVEHHLTVVAERSLPFLVELRGTGTFQPRSPVVFVQLAQGIAGCERLEGDVRSGPLERPLHFPYHPHVTVAHNLPADGLRQAFELLADYRAQYLVDRFTLYVHESDNWVPYRTFEFAGQD